MSKEDCILNGVGVIEQFDQGSDMVWCFNERKSHWLPGEGFAGDTGGSRTDSVAVDQELNDAMVA